MALYYFDFREGGDLFTDAIGTECDDDAAAEIEAVRALAEIAADLLPTRLPSVELAMQVRRADEHHVAEAQLLFSVRTMLPSNRASLAGGAK